MKLLCRFFIFSIFLLRSDTHTLSVVYRKNLVCVESFLSANTYDVSVVISYYTHVFLELIVFLPEEHAILNAASMPLKSAAPMSVTNVGE